MPPGPNSKVSVFVSFQSRQGSVVLGCVSSIQMNLCLISTPRLFITDSNKENTRTRDGESNPSEWGEGTLSDDLRLVFQ